MQTKGGYTPYTEVKMKTTTPFSVILVVFYVSHHAMGQDVMVQVGTESVSLQCSKSLNMDNAPSVVWKKGSEIVHTRVKQGDDLRKQSPQFKGRTQMKPDALQTGNLTLTLFRPTLNDTGTYTCEAAEDTTVVEWTSVKLTVKEQITSQKEPGDSSGSPGSSGSSDTFGYSGPSDPPGSSGLVAALVTVGVLGVLALVFLALVLKRKKENEGFKDACVGVITCRKGQYDSPKSSDRD